MNDKTILLVEDNPQDEMPTLRALRKANAVNQADMAGDGQPALESLFREGPKPPAGVMLDIGPPRP